jgi:hypothetical protein
MTLSTSLQTGYILFKFLSLKGEGVYWLWEALFDSGPDLVKSMYLVDVAHPS